MRLYHWLLRSEAWRSLSPNARALYIEMVDRYYGMNNGRIGFSVRDAAEVLHIGKNAATAAFVELQDRGFIVTAKRGGFNLRYKDQMATEWRLTEYQWDTNATGATKEFMRWTPEKYFTVPVAGQSVPVAGQMGTCEGTVSAKMSRMGTCEGTVEAEKQPVLSRHKDTYSIPGDKPSKERTPRRRVVAAEVAPATVQSPKPGPGAGAKSEPAATAPKPASNGHAAAAPANSSGGLWDTPEERVIIDALRNNAPVEHWEEIEVAYPNAIDDETLDHWPHRERLAAITCLLRARLKREGVSAQQIEHALRVLNGERRSVLH